MNGPSFGDFLLLRREDVVELAQDCIGKNAWSYVSHIFLPYPEPQ
jgi:hypothetical protein